MIGTRVYTKEEFGQAVEYTKDLQEQLEKVVTHIVPMKDAERVFDMIADVSEGTVKAVSYTHLRSVFLKCSTKSRYSCQI